MCSPLCHLFCLRFCPEACYYRLTPGCYDPSLWWSEDSPLTSSNIFPGLELCPNFCHIWQGVFTVFLTGKMIHRILAVCCWQTQPSCYCSQYTVLCTTSCCMASTLVDFLVFAWRHWTLLECSGPRWRGRPCVRVSASGQQSAGNPGCSVSTGSSTPGMNISP